MQNKLVQTRVSVNQRKLNKLVQTFQNPALKAPLNGIAKVWREVALQLVQNINKSPTLTKTQENLYKTSTSY